MWVVCPSSKKKPLWSLHLDIQDNAKNGEGSPQWLNQPKHKVLHQSHWWQIPVFVEGYRIKYAWCHSRSTDHSAGWFDVLESTGQGELAMMIHRRLTWKHLYSSVWKCNGNNQSIATSKSLITAQGVEWLSIPYIDTMIAWTYIIRCWRIHNSRPSLTTVIHMLR